MFVVLSLPAKEAGDLGRRSIDGHCVGSHPEASDVYLMTEDYRGRRPVVFRAGVRRGVGRDWVGDGGTVGGVVGRPEGLGNGVFRGITDPAPGWAPTQ